MLKEQVFSNNKQKNDKFSKDLRRSLWNQVIYIFSDLTE